MPSFFPRLGVRVLAIAVATLAVFWFLPLESAYAAADHLQLLNVSANETANRGADDVTVNALDSGGGTAMAYSGTVTFSATCGDCFSVSLNSDMSSPLAGKAYTFNPVNPMGPDTGSKHFFIRWTEAAVGAPQKLHVDGSGVTGTDAANTTTVVSNNAVTLDWTAPQTNATQNTPENITITIKNAAGQSQPNTYTGTVTFVASCATCFTITPNDGGADTNKYTFVPGDNSAKTFSLTWTTAGTGRSFSATGTDLATTPTRSKSGINVQAQATTTSSSTSSTTSSSTTTSTTLPPRTKAAIVVTGAAQGGGPHVIARKATDLGQIAYSFYAYDPAFTGGVRVASADVNGDGWDDIITAAGPGGGPHVEVFSGKDPVVNGQRPTLLASFFAYDASFTGGVFVAAGDVNNDGKADIITAPDAGGGPHVRAFDATKLGNADINTAQLLGFMAYDTTFHGGVRVAAADFNNDGRADIVTAPGPGGGPHVRFWSGTNAGELGGGHGFFAYDPSFTGGVYLAALNASSPYVITGAGAGGGRHVRVFSLQGVEKIGFMADTTSSQGAVPAVGRTATMADGFFYVARATGNPAVQRFDLVNGQQIDAFPAYQAGIGVFVAVGVF